MPHGLTFDCFLSHPCEMAALSPPFPFPLLAFFCSDDFDELLLFCGLSTGSESGVSAPWVSPSVVPMSMVLDLPLSLSSRLTAQLGLSVLASSEVLSLSLMTCILAAVRFGQGIVNSSSSELKGKSFSPCQGSFRKGTIFDTLLQCHRSIWETIALYDTSDNYLAYDIPKGSASSSSSLLISRSSLVSFLFSMACGFGFEATWGMSAPLSLPLLLAEQNVKGLLI